MICIPKILFLDSENTIFSMPKILFQELLSLFKAWFGDYTSTDLTSRLFYIKNDNYSLNT